MDLQDEVDIRMYESRGLGYYQIGYRNRYGRGQAKEDAMRELEKDLGQPLPAEVRQYILDWHVGM
jgi:hypothetical protein